MPPEPSVTFPAIHPDVGDIKIHDDGSELTLIAGNFTHGHFLNFNSKSSDVAEDKMVEDIIRF